MKPTTTLFVVAIFSTVPALAETSYVDAGLLSWRARGLEAKDKIIKYTKKGKLTNKEQCEVKLEEGFFAFQMDKTSTLMSSGDDSFTAVLQLGDSVDNTATIFFMHRKPYKAPVQIAATDMKKGWAIEVMPGRPQGSFIVTGPKCSYSFNFPDYLHPETEEEKTTQKTKKPPEA